MNVREMSADELFAEANRELIRIIKGGKYSNMLKRMPPVKEYSIENQILINLQKQNVGRVRCLEEWNNLDRRVNKGEKGIKIILKQRGPDGEPRYRTGYVFDISQTSGLNKEIFTAQDAYIHALDELTDAVKAQSTKYKIAKMEPSVVYDAVIDIEKKEIKINETLPKKKYMEVLVTQITIANSLDICEDQGIDHVSITNIKKLEIDSAVEMILSYMGIDYEMNQKLMRQFVELSDSEIMKFKTNINNAMRLANTMIYGIDRYILKNDMKNIKEKVDVEMKEQIEKESMK